MFTRALRQFTSALSPTKQLPIRLCSTASEPQPAAAVASSGERRFRYLFSKFHLFRLVFDEKFKIKMKCQPNIYFRYSQYQCDGESVEHLQS